jgi:type 1 fimbria pilin
MLKRLLTGCAIAVVAAAFAPRSAAAQAAEAMDMTVSGTVVDITCKFAKGASGDAHRACGEVCANAGLPLAILADDGTIYIPLGQDAGKPATVDLKPHVDHHVTVTGKVFSSGNAKGIMISEVSMGQD